MIIASGFIAVDCNDKPFLSGPNQYLPVFRLKRECFEYWSGQPKVIEIIMSDFDTGDNREIKSIPNGMLNGRTRKHGDMIEEKDNG